MPKATSALEDAFSSSLTLRHSGSPASLKRKLRCRNAVTVTRTADEDVTTSISCVAKKWSIAAKCALASQSGKPAHVIPATLPARALSTICSGGRVRYEDLHAGRHGSEIHRRAKHNAISAHHLVVQQVHIIVHGATISAQARVATAAEADIQMRKLGPGSRSALVARRFQNSVQKRCGAFSGKWRLPLMAKIFSSLFLPRSLRDPSEVPINPETIPL